MPLIFSVSEYYYAIYAITLCDSFGVGTSIFIVILPLKICKYKTNTSNIPTRSLAWLYFIKLLQKYVSVHCFTHL